MSSRPNAKLKLPTELLTSIFELVSPEALVVLTRCSKCFYEICNPLLYREVYLHTPTQLIALLESQKAMRMLGATESLVIDDFVLYLEAWAGNEPSNPIHSLVRVLHGTTLLRSLKITQSNVPGTFSRRADWGIEFGHTSELSHAAGDPLFLPNLRLISVFSPPRVDKSLFEDLCYDRVIECYSFWNDTYLQVKVFPALERSDVTAPGPHLSPAAISRLAAYPKQYISGRDLGRLVQQSLDLDSRLKVTNFGLLLQFPDAILHDKPSHIHNTFSWLKAMLSTAGFSQLQGFHVRFKSPPLDRASSLDAQRLGLEELQTAAPALTAVGMSSTRIFWRRWIPELGETPSYSNIPHWTPCPEMSFGTTLNVRSILTWWLNALGLNILDIQDRRVMKDSAKQLGAAMHERWRDLAPTETTLYDRLLSHFPTVDSLTP